MKRFSLLAVVAVLGAQFAAPVQKAAACSCMPQPVETIFAEGNLVFTGTPVQEKMTGDFLRTVTFDVETVWHGNASSEIDIVTGKDSAMCGVNFELHSEVTILVREVEGNWAASLCDQSFQDEEGNFLSVQQAVQARIATAPFKDVPTNSVNAEAIRWAKQEGIVEGYNDGTFRPTHAVNRAEFVKILMEAYGIDTRALCKIAPFADAPLNQWYGPYVQSARCKGIVAGYSDGTFKPSDSINFAEAAKIIAQLHSGTTIDAGADTWYAPYVLYLHNNGASLLEISPSTIVTRELMVQMMYRLQHP